MKLELSERYARTLVRSLEDREETLSEDYERYRGGEIGDAMADELADIRAVKDYLKEKLLQL